MQEQHRKHDADRHAEAVFVMCNLDSSNTSTKITSVKLYRQNVMAVQDEAHLPKDTPSGLMHDRKLELAIIQVLPLPPPPRALSTNAYTQRRWLHLSREAGVEHVDDAAYSQTNQAS